MFWSADGRARTPEDALSTHADLNVAEIAERYAAAWKSHDVDAILALHAEDSTFQAHGRVGQVRGRDALRAAFSQVFERYPEFGVETHRLLLGDRHWTLDWTLTFKPDGKDRRGFRALDVVEVDHNGLVRSKDTFFNFAEVKAAFEAA
ncbi:nuclear transport factor 2 family protein [Bosea lupini]|uniref:nuclear transport factor 2 family protein n=1 Tax=Bosea lupini TaxID=1036779 RepID=UPI001AD84C55|nr:nuclear transport factor 2 family protein [Bosea lupini]